MWWEMLFQGKNHITNDRERATLDWQRKNHITNDIMNDHEVGYAIMWWEMLFQGKNHIMNDQDLVPTLLNHVCCQPSS